MYIKIKNKKIEIIEKNSFKERFIGLKFILEPIDYGLKYPNRNWFNTNFLCQNVDIVLTDENEIIQYMYENFKTEKTIFPKKNIKNIYILPLNSIKNLKINDKLTNYKNKD